MSKNNGDTLLSEDDSRYVMFPIKDQDIWKMYLKQKYLQKYLQIYGQRLSFAKTIFEYNLHL